MVGNDLDCRVRGLYERTVRYSELFYVDPYSKSAPNQFAACLGVSNEQYIRSDAYQNIVNALNPAIMAVQFLDEGVNEKIVGRAVESAERSLDSLRLYAALMVRYHSFAMQELATPGLTSNGLSLSEYVRDSRRRLVQEEHYRRHSPRAA